MVSPDSIERERSLEIINDKDKEKRREEGEKKTERKKARKGRKEGV